MMLVLGVMLCCIAILLASAPLRASRPRPRRKGYGGPEEQPPVELVLDLAASLLESGLPIGRVLEILGSRIGHCAHLRTVARCLELNMEWEQAWQHCPSWLDPLQRALHFTQSSGAGSAQLLRSFAQLQRRERTKKAQEIGAQFGTKLVLPLGLCALPSFIALGVVPIILALLPEW
ncbi:type II secretion system F family protein [Glutamicibacter sp. MNS18]|uniref:type II secretion system F family protein n=1 Tax=Glutamicibacter sp. MNS18 TaxID=2989817 RepID=UPI0022367AFA|nr:type II secretion system F family protein [Glutamicibacter sp. MNS18]MCW4464009.1 type II secretion system F family protein [Glutamicibacter sp. MNS18]